MYSIDELAKLVANGEYEVEHLPPPDPEWRYLAQFLIGRTFKTPDGDYIYPPLSEFERIRMDYAKHVPEHGFFVRSRYHQEGESFYVRIEVAQIPQHVTPKILLRKT